jgi:hypothetical protein
MAHPVTRVYDTHQKAAEAVSGLKQYGFTPDRITVIDGTADARQIAALGVPAAEASAYATAVAGGASLVSVDPPFGHALAATEIMDGCGPVEVDAGPAAPRAATDDNAAPLSDALHVPVLTGDKPSETYYLDNPSPLSSALGLPVLTKRSTSASLLPSDWTLSGMLGLKMLTDTKAPTVSGTSVNRLSKHPAPLSEAIHAPVLTDEQSPLAARDSAPVRSDDPAPLSEAVGAPVLTKGTRE